MPGRVPDRWEDYDPMGKPMKGTRFIAFKVPLDKTFSDKLNQQLWFTPDILAKTIKEQGHQLGLIIDLTNTSRYYNPWDVQNAGIEYQKIMTEGKLVPSRNIQKRFNAVVNDFLARNTDNGALIGVHCTHGLNRTGYMICRYMIDFLKFTPDEAVEVFNEARGYDIERENYLEDLKNQSRSEEKPEEDSYTDDHTQYCIRTKLPGNSPHGYHPYGDRLSQGQFPNYSQTHNGKSEIYHQRPIHEHRGEFSQQPNGKLREYYHQQSTYRYGTTVSHPSRKFGEGHNRDSDTCKGNGYQHQSHYGPQGWQGSYGSYHSQRYNDRHGSSPHPGGSRHYQRPSLYKNC